MTTQREKIRKLRALARSPNHHEAASAKAKAEELERRQVTAKTLAHAIAQLLDRRGMKVRVNRRRRADDDFPQSKVDADIRYFNSSCRGWPHEFKIEITEYREGGKAVMRL